MNTKAKGSRLERRCMAYYEALGYNCTKSGGSLGTWDILAIGPHDAFLCQSKANRKPSKAEMRQMEEFSCPPFMHKVLFIWHDGKPNDPEIITIARNRPEKEAVDMITHPITIRRS